MANIGYSFLMVLAAFLWGSTFVAQIEGNDVGPFAFVCMRNFIATGVLFGLAKVLDKFNKSPRRPKTKEENKALWKAGLFCGLTLFFAMNLQQTGLFLGCSAGKAGFLTACYIIFVPILSTFFGKKISPKIWLCVAITLEGLYLLCIKEDFTIQPSDIVLLLCALAFAAHILVVGKYGPYMDNVRLSAIQFLVVATLSIFPMFFVDLKGSLAGFGTVIDVYSHFKPWIPLLYAAILSSGVAFTLQIVAQNKLRPTIASLLMSLESVFSVISGWVMLGERFTLQEGIGCVLMFTAVILAQVKIRRQ
ncbi:Threonine/homoserine efflux transporter RhtA [Fibrobacter sp. UWB7]|nr:Threonine/homoserine efflux transporter RhtA [Fibrobacter sp. UWB7]